MHIWCSHRHKQIQIIYQIYFHRQILYKILYYKFKLETQIIKPNTTHLNFLPSQMSQRQQKLKYHNYLTMTNGCKIPTNGAKPLHHNNPQNILTDNMRQLWLTKQLPAVCIIDMRQMIQRPACWNRIGFMCWHEYDSNPRLIEVEYTGQDNPENAVWVVLAKIRLELTSNWQHFKIPVTPSKNVSFLKLKIVQNHSQPNDQDQNEYHSQAGTYLNQVSLSFVQQIIQSRVQLTAANSLHPREKTFSDYRKLTTNDKQFKRLTQKVKHLSNDNEAMRRTIDHQNSIIIKLQEAIQTLVENVGQLQGIQKLQGKKIQKLENYRHQASNNKKNHNNGKNNNNNSDQPHKKQRIQQFFDDQSQIILPSQAQAHSQSRPRSHHQSNSRQQPSRISKTNKQSHQKNCQNRSSHKSSHKSHHYHSNQRRVINANINESSQSMSEYQVDERVYGRKAEGQKAKEGVYIPMLQKLQELIMLRDEKKNKLKTHKKHKQSNIILSSSDQQSSNQSQT